MNYEVVKDLLIQKIKNTFMNKFKSVISTDTTYDINRLLYREEIINTFNRITNNLIDSLIDLDPIQITNYLPLIKYENIKEGLIFKLEEYYLYEHEIISAFNINTENLPEIKIKISNILKLGLKYY